MAVVTHGGVKVIRSEITHSRISAFTNNRLKSKRGIWQERRGNGLEGSEDSEMMWGGIIISWWYMSGRVSLQWISIFHPSSIALPGISGFSARHDKYLSASSMEGTNVSVLVVKFPSLLVCKINWNIYYISRGNHPNVFPVKVDYFQKFISGDRWWWGLGLKWARVCCWSLTVSLWLFILEVPRHQDITAAGRAPEDWHLSAWRTSAESGCFPSKIRTSNGRTVE